MGLSSNEIKAAKLGMSVSQYKKLGKPKSAPAKSYSKPSVKGTSSGVPDYVSMINDTYNANRNGTRASQTVTPEKANEMKKQPKYSSSKKSSSSKSTPTPIPSMLNTPKVLGESTSKNAVISANPNPASSSLWRKGLGMGLDVLKNTLPGGAVISNLAKGNNFDLTDILGIPAQASTIDDYWKQQYQDEQNNKVKQSVNDFTGTNIFNTTNPINSPVSTPRPTSSNNQSYSDTSGDNNNRKSTPSPVSNPYNIPQQGNALSDIIRSLIEYKPDNTPTQSNRGTVQRPVGMGQFSSGQFSNGAGGYNLGGGGTVMGGGDSGSPMDENLINQILGIETASAQEMPMQAMSQDYRGQTSPVPGLTNNQMYTMEGNTPVWNSMQGPTNQGEQDYEPTNPGEQDYEPNVQQYSQGSAGGQVPKFDNSGYKDAMKAQKKALNELIKSIKAQYAQSTKEGTTALDASKQQDLLKLSGLFNFGANQDPNSEQRIQYEQRTAGDYAGQLKDFLAKIAQGQTKDISGAQQGYQSSLAQIMQQQAQAKQAYQQQLADQEQMMWDRNYKMQQLAGRGGSGSAGSITYMGNNSNGEPVYRNSKTGAMQVGTGLTKGNNDLMSILAGMSGQGQQSGSWETDPQTGEKIWVTN